MQSFINDPRAQQIIARAKAQIGDFDSCTAHFAKYPTGGSVKLHTDDHACKNRRQLVAIVRAADAGGVLVIEGAVQDLGIGDAVVFDGNKQKHEVTEVTDGERIALVVAYWNS